MILQSTELYSVRTSAHHCYLSVLLEKLIKKQADSLLWKIQKASASLQWTTGHLATYLSLPSIYSVSSSKVPIQSKLKDIQWVLKSHFSFKFLFLQRYRNWNSASFLGTLFDMLVDITLVSFQKMPTVLLNHCFLLCFDLSDEPMGFVTCSYRRKSVILQDTKTTWHSLKLPFVTTHNAWCSTQAHPKALLSPCSPPSPCLCTRLWRHLSWTLAPTQRQGLVVSSVEIGQLCSLLPCSEMCEAILKSTFIFSELMLEAVGITEISF